MHGIVLKQLKDFVVETEGLDAWQAVLEEAGLSGSVFVPVTEYPDEDVLALVAAATELTGSDPEVLLEAFGRFLVGPLVETYGVHVDREWTGLELVANVERYIHEALRAKRLSTYTPPKLEAEWRGDDSVGVVYRSERGFCHLARGIIVGVGRHFEEPFDVEETACVHDGDGHCEFVVTRR
ncbi:MAG: heme NO-binding domain-containing protein [Salinigranum sp.]